MRRPASWTKTPSGSETTSWVMTKMRRALCVRFNRSWKTIFRKMAPDDAPAGNGWLGKFLGNIETAGDTSPLAQFKAVYDDLDNLNEYTSPYAHDSGTAPA